MKKINKICKLCKKEFQIDEVRIRHGRGRFCSIECKKKFKLKDSECKNKVLKTCPVCSKEFYSYKNRTRTFCSNKCSYEARGIGLVKRIVTKPYKKQPISEWRYKKCEICNKQFLAKTKTTANKYCSKSCHAQSQKISMLGKNNPSYIDGRSKNKRGYRGEGWEDTRKDVYKRDNYKCRICGIHCTGKKYNKINTTIQCHHIKPYCGKETDNNIDNLITICLLCHIKIHSRKTY